ncbi:helix-turn-helix domain-containing protein [Kribbella albertanoniae]|uniref:MarR family transcriptional regulator n=1 Tax=Kribbella albertanoniae TaxID=1266829 RepID=A0A4R4QGW8_9ACTN|nr:winged helix-turn-helix domain-containing protein [Kribbella albertanoniae]TDC34443.1 MarR family transcriptional regulator [Kribbella albertanoniae]
MAEKTQVVLTDPRAIRALAHPARQVVIDELYNGRVLTATECAELAGLTPSAMSYHLRALERWGIVERADESADGRERPWRAPARGLVIPSQSTPSGRLANQAMMRVAVDRMLELFADMPGDDPWDDVSAMSRSRLWLTHEETGQLITELQELVDRYRKGRTKADHPADARAVHTMFTVVAAGEAPKA